MDTLGWMIRRKVSLCFIARLLRDPWPEKSQPRYYWRWSYVKGVRAYVNRKLIRGEL